MAQKFLTNIDLVNNQILNARFESVSSDPGSNLFEGRLIYNTTTDTIKAYANGEWRSMPHTITSGGANTAGITIGELNGTVTLTLNLATASSVGLLTAAHFTDLNTSTNAATGSTLVKRDASGNISVAAPTESSHAATKGYVDAARSGLDVKDSVRAATTAAINISADLDNGSVIDGVTLATGDRVLVKNQSSGAENGIYVVVATGAASRSTDADTSAEVTSGMFTFVTEGTVNADSGWVLSTNDTITLGTTALAFSQFSGAGQITAGAGLTKSGNTIDAVGTADRITVNADSIDIASTYVGQSTITTLGTVTTGTWNATTIAIANGGTNATTEANARTNLAAGGTQGAGVSVPVLSRKIALTIGDASAATFTVTHAFNTRDVQVEIYETASPYASVICDVERTTADAVTISFATAPGSGAYRVVVTG
jgi:hypothetical protein